MNSSIPPDMITFDLSYSQNILNEVMSASAFGPERKEEQSIEISPVKFANLNMHETSNVIHIAAFKSRTKVEATKGMDRYYDTSYTEKTYSHFGAGSLNSELATSLIVSPIDLESVVVWEDDAKGKATKEVRHSYASRIEFLQEEAVIEGVTFNKNSERDFWEFIESIPFVRRGGLFLMDNGDLRVVWDDEEDNLVGLQFLGNFLARYVIFKRRAKDELVSRVAGRDTLRGINDQIRAFELGALLSL